MQREILYFKKTPSGKFKQTKHSTQQNLNHSIDTNKTDSTIFIEKLRNEWHKKNLDIGEINKLEAIYETMKQPAVQEKTKEVFTKIKTCATSDAMKGVFNKMSTPHFSDLFKKIMTQEETKGTLEQMLNDSSFSNNAMKLMQDIFNDQDKSEQLSEMFSSMINSDKKD
ncbi:hypothetical protein [Paraliobacillus sp. JSM ZJ581]|uniref:hypothetical protein n=1 Tax=Paraliobacillus sp. JSM ZJ581 TaxID=3342118 RepID=UPI0035A8219A